MSYVEIIRYATLAFPIVAFLFTMPFVLLEYHKYGSISFYKTIISYLFIYYIICSYFLVILPLPKINEVAALTTPRMQLIPFKFVIDFFKNVSINLSDVHSYLNIFRKNYFFVPLFNIFLTMPFGFFLRYYLGKGFKTTIVLTFCLSLFFELTQLSGLYFIYPRSYRLFDVDDLILNTFGGICGYFICSPLLKILPRISLVNNNAKERGRVISGFRRSLAFALDFIIVLTLDLVVIKCFTNNFYLNLIVVFIYYFLVPLFLNSSTVGEAFLNIKVLDYLGRENMARLFYRRILFVLIHIGIPFGLFNIIFNLSNDIIRELGGLVIFGMYIVLCMISVIKYLFTNKEMLFEKISKTKQISTIR